MLNVNPFEMQVAARLLEFFHWRAPWHRTIWTPGTQLLLQEVLEASQAVHEGILFPPTLKNVAHTASVLSGQDPGTGGKVEKRLLQNALNGDIRFQSRSNLAAFRGTFSDDRLSFEGVYSDLAGNRGQWRFSKASPAAKAAGK